ncbi:MAG: hypothetical protein NXH71_00605 [Erythrobacteraceae bacterium]|nr:hypothetical protein [Erythrobacteraceae bacterium]
MMAGSEFTPEARHVINFVPDAEGEELELRVRLLKARDMAAAMRGRSDSPLADWLACQCHDHAGVMVFAARQREARLDLSVQLCRSLIRAAMAADSLHCEEFPI